METEYKYSCENGHLFDEPVMYKECMRDDGYAGPYWETWYGCPVCGCAFDEYEEEEGEE